MRVVHIIKVTGIAGAENHLLTLLPGLIARGADISLIALVEPSNPVEELAKAADALGIPFRRMIIQRHSDVALINRLRRVFRQFKPDIVHTHLVHADSYAIPAAKLARVPIIISSRHNDNQFRRRLVFKVVNSGLWRMTNAGIAISEALRRFTTEVEGAPERKITTIHYGLKFPVEVIEPKTARATLRESLNLPSNALIIGAACRLVEQKGLRYGIEAFASIAADFPDAHLVIAGEGNQRSLLQSLAKSKGIAKRVHFIGWRADLSQVLAGFDIFLAPSLWEGFGLVLLEAMARRLPIIASNVSAIPEIVAHQETGILTPPRDIPALADAMRTLISDEALRYHMGLMGEDRLETHFDAEIMIDKTLQLYQQLSKK